MEFCWSFCALFGHSVGNINLLKYIFVLNICCQQFGAYITVEYICWHVNSWGDKCWAQGWGIYVYISKYMCWIYAVNYFGSVCKFNICVGVGYLTLVGAVGGWLGNIHV